MRHLLHAPIAALGAAGDGMSAADSPAGPCASPSSRSHWPQTTTCAASPSSRSPASGWQQQRQRRSPQCCPPSCTAFVPCGSTAASTIRRTTSWACSARWAHSCSSATALPAAAAAYILCQGCHGSQHSLTGSKQDEQHAPGVHCATLLWLEHSSPTTHHRSLCTQLVCMRAGEQRDHLALPLHHPPG